VPVEELGMLMAGASGDEAAGDEAAGGGSAGAATGEQL